MPALWNPECPGIDDPVRPSKAQRFQLIHEVTHGLATLELQHERHVFEQQPPWGSSLVTQAFEQFANETRLLPPDSGGFSSLTQILAWKSRGNYIDVRETAKLSDVWRDFHVEPLLQDVLRSGFQLAEQLGSVSRSMQTEFDSADSSE